MRPFALEQGTFLDLHLDDQIAFSLGPVAQIPALAEDQFPASLEISWELHHFLDLFEQSSFPFTSATFAFDFLALSVTFMALVLADFRAVPILQDPLTIACPAHFGLCSQGGPTSLARVAVLLFLDRYGFLAPVQRLEEVQALSGYYVQVLVPCKGRLGGRVEDVFYFLDVDLPLSQTPTILHLRTHHFQSAKICTPIVFLGPD